MSTPGDRALPAPVDPQPPRPGWPSRRRPPDTPSVLAEPRSQPGPNTIVSTPRTDCPVRRSCRRAGASRCRRPTPQWPARRRPDKHGIDASHARSGQQDVETSPFGPPGVGKHHLANTGNSEPEPRHEHAAGIRRASTRAVHRSGQRSDELASVRQLVVWSSHEFRRHARERRGCAARRSPGPRSPVCHTLHGQLRCRPSETRSSAAVTRSNACGEVAHGRITSSAHILKDPLHTLRHSGPVRRCRGCRPTLAGMPHCHRQQTSSNQQAPAAPRQQSQTV